MSPLYTFRCMGSVVSCRVEQFSAASAAVVYDTLMDASRWQDWMPTVSAASWEAEPGESAVGAVRRVRNGLFVTRDQVTAAARPHHHAYVAMIRFLPISDFHGDVRIEKRPNGSLIVWTVTCRSHIPATGSLFRFTTRRSYTRLAAALAREAERRA